MQKTNVDAQAHGKRPDHENDGDQIPAHPGKQFFDRFIPIRLLAEVTADPKNGDRSPESPRRSRRHPPVNRVQLTEKGLLLIRFPGNKNSPHRRTACPAVSKLPVYHSIIGFIILSKKAMRFLYIFNNCGFGSAGSPILSDMLHLLNTTCLIRV